MPKQIGQDPPTLEDIERWKALRAQGISVKNIARRAGRSTGYIYACTAGVQTGAEPATRDLGASLSPTRGHRRRGRKL